MKKKYIIIGIVVILLLMGGIVLYPKLSSGNLIQNESFEVKLKSDTVYVHIGEKYDPLDNVVVTGSNVENNIETDLDTNKLGDYTVNVTSSKNDVQVKNQFKVIVADTSVEVVSPKIAVNVGKEINLWSNVIVYNIDGEIVSTLKELKTYDTEGVYDETLNYDGKTVSYQVDVVKEDCELIWVVDTPSHTEKNWVIDVPYKAAITKEEWVVDVPGTKEKGHYEEKYIIDVPYQPAVKEQGHYEEVKVIDVPYQPAVTEEKYVVDSPEVKEQGHYETVHHDAEYETIDIYEDVYYIIFTMDDGSVREFKYSEMPCSPNDYDFPDGKRWVSWRGDYRYEKVREEQKLVKDAWSEEVYIVDVPYQAEQGHYETVIIKEEVKEVSHIEKKYIIDVEGKPEIKEQGHTEKIWVVDSPAVEEKGHYETVIITPETKEEGHYEEKTIPEVGHYEKGC